MQKTNTFFNSWWGAILAPVVFSWLCTLLAVRHFNDYAYVLFFGLPFCMGLFPTLLLKREQLLKNSTSYRAGFTALGFYTVGLLLFAQEGIICLVMAAPLGALLTCLGATVGQLVIRRNKSTSTLLLLGVVLLPLLMAFEDKMDPDEELRSVTTTLEIDAPPETVWKNVIAFPPLKAPTEAIFKTGIAYPTNATIKGSGVGAVRYCNFSTGAFVEPITVWEPPHLLKFSVEQQPAPMKELSMYDVYPNHLHGYWVSQRGEFNLEALPNGGTRIKGTTWYSNKIKPAFYWTLWSDYIVHTIHRRVLQHIKEQSEAAAHPASLKENKHSEF